MSYRGGGMRETGGEGASSEWGHREGRGKDRRWRLEGNELRLATDGCNGSGGGESAGAVPVQMEAVEYTVRTSVTDGLVLKADQSGDVVKA